ncbi:vacuolar sorting protein 35 [Cavenderia fasciculata]|uniref:Vacuolar sorting protein 35 n=1 Tax=Cavenderia fasciculata TaxID=261658 RepID=F4QAN7_CACFS|nr:vacuolar sorting protein 35 [Cavenderia fasciculata]EGG15756.1 vacuolar sorting protein 35 [Cavenderia fasciculata]|eukprot:XP_004354503.1 vacuolar sorting protein 35 [Cavenderia fasciculata]
MARDEEFEQQYAAFQSESAVSSEQRVLYFINALIVSLVPVYLYHAIFFLSFEQYFIVYGAVTLFSAIVLTFAYNNIFRMKRLKLSAQRDHIITLNKTKAQTTDKKAIFTAKKEAQSLVTSHEAIAQSIMYNNALYLIYLIHQSSLVCYRRSPPPSTSISINHHHHHHSHPPPSTIMSCISKPKTEETKISGEIDKELRHEEKRMKRDIQILLLGAGECGKSTIFKQLKILQDNGKWQDHELLEFRNSIYINITSQLAVLASAASELNIALLPEHTEAAERIKKMQPLIDEWTDQTADDAFKLWLDPGIQQVYERRDKDFQLNDSAKYFFDNLLRISDSKYIPTPQDALRSRVMTKGIVEAEVCFDGINMKIIDVGGQRSQRRKWIHCFDGVSAVIFVAALSEYDQMCREVKENRLDESISLFSEIANSEWFVETPIILFLNKKDLFIEKLKRVGYNQYDNNYRGDNSFKDVSEHIAQKFKTVVKSTSKSIYVHYTIAIDTQNIDYVFKAVKEILLRKTIADKLSSLFFTTLPTLNNLSILQIYKERERTTSKRMSKTAQPIQLTPEEEQKKFLEEQKRYLEEAKNNVMVQGHHMKVSLDNAKLMDALKYASNIINELRTSLLSPKSYYALYMVAFDYLQHLNTYLFEEKHGKKMIELYEIVQHAGNVLPRLYLLITVGSVYIKTKQAPAKDVLMDLIEMCRGVQHPTRGLFLRYYLSEVTKDKLPDAESDDVGGSVYDSIEFIIQNFTETNKLWVRMQHQAPNRDKDRRENERLDLRVLVGKNLSRLSQLDGVDVKVYSQTVLPKVVEQIINCKDKIAQQYLMEILIQVFPDEFHLATLDTIISTCSQLQPGVDVKTIIASLIDRLANYASRNSIPDDIDIFSIFFSNVKEVIKARPNMELQDILGLHVSLLNLTLKCYPEKRENANEVLGLCQSILATKSKEEINKPSCVKQIVQLLQIPLEVFKNVLAVLKLTAYQPLIKQLSYNNRKKVSLDIVNSTLKNSTIIEEPEEVNILLETIQTLIKDEEDQPSADEIDKEDFVEEQNKVSSLIHLFQSEDPEKLFKIYIVARSHFGKGGAQRIKHTLVPLVFRSLKFVTNLKKQVDEGVIQLDEQQWTGIGTKIFTFVMETIKALVDIKLAELSFRLYLQAVQTADKCSLQKITKEFSIKALQIFQEDIADFKAQVNALTLLISTLNSLTLPDTDLYETLAGQTIKQASRLLTAQDQAKVISLCSHLFWVSHKNRQHKEPEQVLQALRKSLLIISNESNPGLSVFVDILNECLYYFDQKSSAIPGKFISDLVELIRTTHCKDGESSSIYLQNTIKYINSRKESDSSYAEISV